MNKKTTICGIIFTAALGTLGHFFYEWSGQNKAVGYFSAVNESTFEHLKLLFWPVLIFSVFEYFFYKRKNSVFIPARTAGLLSGLIFIVTAYYTISGITGNTDMPVINIGIFLLSVVITYTVSAIIIKNRTDIPTVCTVSSIILILLIIIGIFAWTYNPPSIGLFADPTM